MGFSDGPSSNPSERSMNNSASGTKVFSMDNEYFKAEQLVHSPTISLLEFNLSMIFCLSAMR